MAGLKGGLGTASTVLENGVRVAALFAVNALGSPLMGDSHHFQAALFEQCAEFGGHGLPGGTIENGDQVNIKFRGETRPNTNTTIGIVATDATLSKSETKRLAIAAHDGISRAIWPAHTPMDGDLVFSIATERSGISADNAGWVDLSAHAASVTARAIARGIYDADPHENDMFPTYKDCFGTIGRG